jgi:uroporphyrinogen-III synthase
VEGKRVLILRAESGRHVLETALRERGAEVDVIPVYRTLRETPPEEQLEAASRADYVTFTAGSTVRNFVEAIGDRFPRGARVVSIGPVTSDTARELGIEVHVEAQRHDVDGLVDALLEDARSS